MRLQAVTGGTIKGALRQGQVLEVLEQGRLRGKCIARIEARRCVEEVWTGRRPT